MFGNSWFKKEKPLLGSFGSGASGFGFSRKKRGLVLSISGGSVSTSGDYKIAEWSGPGSITVTSYAEDSPGNNVDIYMVGGGGGGGRTSGSASGHPIFAPKGGGGGGAGGVIDAPGFDITTLPASISITIGGGGGGAPNPSTCGSPGGNTLMGTLMAIGGGGGGSAQGGYTNGNFPTQFPAYPGPGSAGVPGGCGGGAASTGYRAGQRGGEQAQTSPYQPNIFGAPTASTQNGYSANGSGAGNNSGKGGGANRDLPAPLNVPGSPRPFSGGGGAQNLNGHTNGAQPGTSPVGGSSGSNPGGSGSAGSPGTGSGGGGGGTSGGGAGSGSSGRAFIRWKFQ